MKRFLFNSLFFILCSVSAFAQTDAKAKAILAAVSKKYGAYTTIKTSFSYYIDNPQANLKQTVTGVLYVQPKADKYYISMKDQDMISDGRQQWTYLKADKEVQLNDVDKSSKAINPAKIFTIHEKGFKSLYTGDVREGGKIYHVVELSPIDAKQSFFKVRLNIDKQSKLIRRALIFDKNGSHYTYTITSFTPNPKVPASFFTFDAAKHPGVEVVDLR